MSKTHGEQFNEALACKDSAEAAIWLEQELARYKTEFGIGPEQARKTIMTNIGYMAGYYDAATADRILELFGAPHPFFGRNYHSRVTPEEALAAGSAASQKGERET